MPRISEPVTVKRRSDSKTFRLTLNPTSGIPDRICSEWRQRSFKELPDELAEYRNPKTKAAARTGAYALIEYLKKKLAEGGARRIVIEDINVGDWVVKFTNIETSPRTAINASRNRPYSIDTLVLYRDYYTNHIQGDPLCDLKMAEIEEEDVLEFISRMSVKKIKGGRTMGGTRTFAGVVGFIKMTFKEYQRRNRKWTNPFQYLDSPVYHKGHRDALSEDEVLKLFSPGVLRRTIEVAVCSAIFLSGLRRSEVAALKPEDLDWHTPKITIRRAWQYFENKENRVLGPPKGKRERDVPFDPILQDAIKKLWKENGKHEFVFSLENGELIGQSWIRFNFRRWIKRAGIELAGRKIVPHSARHSLASLLEERGVSLRYIQELLGHSDLQTTKGYLHSTEKTIRDIGKKISEVSKGALQEEEPEQKIVDFKVS